MVVITGVRRQSGPRPCRQCVIASETFACTTETAESAVTF